MPLKMTKICVLVWKGRKADVCVWPPLHESKNNMFYISSPLHQAQFGKRGPGFTLVWPFHPTIQVLTRIQQQSFDNLATKGIRISDDNNPNSFRVIKVLRLAASLDRPACHILALSPATTALNADPRNSATLFHSPQSQNTDWRRINISKTSWEHLKLWINEFSRWLAMRDRLP